MAITRSAAQAVVLAVFAHHDVMVLLSVTAFSTTHTVYLSFHT